jgi:polysaccharide biosynthesis/export protein
MHFDTRKLALLGALLSCWGGVAAGQDTVKVEKGDTVTIPPPPAYDLRPRPTGVLRQGDVLELKVYRDSELGGAYPIDAGGNVSIPGLGVIHAAGLTPVEVSQLMVQTMRNNGFRNPQLAVRPLIRVSVLGMVRIPQLYTVDPGLSLIQVLTMAGGPAEHADLRRARIIRDGLVFPVDLQSALAGSSAGRIALYSNDVIYIPPKKGLTRENAQFIVSIVAASLSALTAIVVLTHY